MEKIGRNEKCPCGSGKKFKYCCLGKESDVSISFADPDELVTFVVESESDERLKHIGQIMLMNMASLHQNFDTEGVGCTAFRIGDFSFLTIYDPLEPVTEDELYRMYYDLSKKRIEKR